MKKIQFLLASALFGIVAISGSASASTEEAKRDIVAAQTAKVLDYLHGAEKSLWLGSAKISLDKNRSEIGFSELYNFSNLYGLSDGYGWHQGVALSAEADDKSTQSGFELLLNVDATGNPGGVFWINQAGNQGGSRAQDFNFGTEAASKPAGDAIDFTIPGIGYINADQIASTLTISLQRQPPQTYAQLNKIVAGSITDNVLLSHIFKCISSTIQATKEVYTFSDNVVLSAAQMQNAFDPAYVPRPKYSPVVNFQAQVEFEPASGKYNLVSYSLQSPVILRLPEELGLGFLGYCQR